MAVIMQRESTEFHYWPVRGGPLPTRAEVAFMPNPGQRPQESDWKLAEIVSGPGHPLWQDAQATGLKGDYYVAILIGPYEGPVSSATRTVLEPGVYQPWLRLWGDTERPVRIGPEVLEVQ